MSGRSSADPLADVVVRAAMDRLGEAPVATLDPEEVERFERGEHPSVHRLLGAHRVSDGSVRFVVWAPRAAAVAVALEGELLPLSPVRSLWVGHARIPDGGRYRIVIRARDGRVLLRADPAARAFTSEPGFVARVIAPSTFPWKDGAWLAGRTRRVARPLSIYEVHVGSWGPRGGYRALAEELVPYVRDLAFSHVELMPVMEHPFGGSWGYQVSGLFAPASRWGEPDDLRLLIDRCHRAGIGVILDWVPGHFCRDEGALSDYDGGPLLEHPDPRRAEHRQWGTRNFDLDEPRVRQLLIASARWWIEGFHADGLRCDAIASMLCLDYAAPGPDDWLPNPFGGRTHLGAVTFCRDLTDAVHREHPGVILVAEDSSAWPGVTAPTSEGGLGFDRKWNLGWMHDTLEAHGDEPVGASPQGPWHTLTYAFDERFVLPLSHDEVVHGKGALLAKLPGDLALRRAGLRALYGLMWAHPGDELLFMGAEWGALAEWDDASHLVPPDDPPSQGLRALVRDLNRLRRARPALAEASGPGTVEARAHEHGGALRAMERRDPVTGDWVLIVANLHPQVREWRVGVRPGDGLRELLNTDAVAYGGTGVGNLGRAPVDVVPAHGYPASAVLTLPPRGVLWLVPEEHPSP